MTGNRIFYVNKTETVTLGIDDSHIVNSIGYSTANEYKDHIKDVSCSPEFLLTIDKGIETLTMLKESGAKFFDTWVNNDFALEISGFNVRAETKEEKEARIEADRQRKADYEAVMGKHKIEEAIKLLKSKGYKVSL